MNSRLQLCLTHIVFFITVFANEIERRLNHVLIKIQKVHIIPTLLIIF